MCARARACVRVCACCAPCLHQGHNTSADHWAFGVFLYEISSGTMPFYDPDPMEIYELILAGEVRFPNYFTRDLIDAISKLLVQNQARRLGNLKGGIRDIQNHRWFTGIDWDALENAPGKLRELREVAASSAGHCCRLLPAAVAFAAATCEGKHSISSNYTSAC